MYQFDRQPGNSIRAISRVVRKQSEISPEWVCKPADRSDRLDFVRFAFEALGIPVCVPLPSSPICLTLRTQIRTLPCILEVLRTTHKPVPNPQFVFSGFDRVFRPHAPTGPVWQFGVSLCAYAPAQFAGLSTGTCPGSLDRLRSLQYLLSYDEEEQFSCITIATLV